MVDTSKAFEDAWKRADYLAAIRALDQLRKEGKEVIFNFNPPNDATLRSISGYFNRTAPTDSSPHSNRPSMSVPTISIPGSLSSAQFTFQVRAEQSPAK